MNTRFTLKPVDALKGAILAVGTPVLALLQQLIPSWTPYLTSHFGQTGGILIQAALGALVSYLIKNFFTNDIKTAQNTLVDASKKAPNSEQQNSLVQPILTAQTENPKP